MKVKTNRISPAAVMLCLASLGFAAVTPTRAADESNSMAGGPVTAPIAPATNAPAIWNDPSQPLELRVQDLLGRLTVEEKVEMLTVAASTRFKGVPRLGIPNLIASDGPRGPHGPVGYPCGISMGSSFDPALIMKEASAMGEECRARGIAMLYGPAINIERDPLAGRFFEYFTEDPCLNAQLAAAYVRGVQSQHVAACAKHFVCNNRDWNRNNYMAQVDARTLHEIYFPAFKAAVTQAGVLAIMTAANGLNGEFCSDSRSLLTGTLKNAWGFSGFVFTDGLGSRSTLPAAQAGLDVSNLGQPAKSLFGSPLLAAVKAGTVSTALINEKVRRILRVMAWAGNLDPGGVRPHGTVDFPAHEALALKGAEAGLVLLKNDHEVLPFDVRKLKTIVVLGPNADQRFCETGLGGSSWVNSPDEVTVLNGIRALAGPTVRINYIPRDQLAGFETINPRFLRTDNGQPGFDAQYFNRDLKGSPALTRREDSINFNWEMKSPDVTKIDVDTFSARFTTTINPPVTGAYTLRIKTDNDASLYVDRNGGAPIAVTTRQRGSGEALATVQLVQGTPCFIRIDYHKDKGDAYLSLDWAMPRPKGEMQGKLPDLDRAIQSADAVVYVGGTDHSLDAEGRDRLNMDFPQWQENLINHLVQLNSRTVVVLINGCPLDIGGWLEKVPAVLESWYDGSRAGTAVANALFGAVNPSGRLPFTWPKKLQDSPAHAVGTEDINLVSYREGVFVGYRYYLTRQITPEFPFGYGLSYTQFRYSNLTVTQTNGGWIARAEVTNIGQRAGGNVAQFYLHPESSPVDRPLRELKGFQKVFLSPGETARVAVMLQPADFAYYDVDRQAWHVAAGDYEVQLGNSSADIRLKRAVHVAEALIKD